MACPEVMGQKRWGCKTVSLLFPRRLRRPIYPSTCLSSTQNFRAMLRMETTGTHNSRGHQHARFMPND